jgi:hypothetical protein
VVPKITVFTAEVLCMKKKKIYKALKLPKLLLYSYKITNNDDLENTDFKRKPEGQNQISWPAVLPTTCTVAIPLMMWLAATTFIVTSHMEKSHLKQPKYHHNGMHHVHFYTTSFPNLEDKGPLKLKKMHSGLMASHNKSFYITFTPC